MRKINVVGNSGSGKTTFGRKLAKALSIDFIEMDAVFWGKDWYWPADEELFSNLEAALDRETWVLDGNYTRTIPINSMRMQLISLPRSISISGKYLSLMKVNGCLRASQITSQIVASTDG